MSFLLKQLNYFFICQLQFFLKSRICFLKIFLRFIFFLLITQFFIIFLFTGIFIYYVLSQGQFSLFGNLQLTIMFFKIRNCFFQPFTFTFLELKISFYIFKSLTNSIVIIFFVLFQTVSSPVLIFFFSKLLHQKFLIMLPFFHVSGVCSLHFLFFDLELLFYFPYLFFQSLHFIIFPQEIIFYSLLFFFQNSYLSTFRRQMQLQCFFLIKLTYLQQQFLFFHLDLGQLFPQVNLVLFLETNCIPQLFQFFSLTFEHFFIIRLNVFLVKYHIQLFKEFLILALIKLFGLCYFSFKLFFLAVKLKFAQVVLPLTLSQFLFESYNFLIFFIDSLLIWSFHFCYQFDSDHILIQVGDHFDLKILQFLLFLFYEHFQFFYLGSQGRNIFVVLCYLQLMLFLELVI